MEKPPFNFEKMDKYEIPPEFVKKIEGLNLTVDDKVNFLLTKADLKPASEIDLIIKSEYESETTEHMTEEDIQKNLNIIKESGLPFQLGRREITKETYQTEKEVGVEKFYQREQMKVLIGRSKEDLDILIQALQTKSDELLGKAFGFPKTAIEAFTGKREKLDISALPQETRESDAVLFHHPFFQRTTGGKKLNKDNGTLILLKK